MFDNVLVDILGWLGAALLLIAYGLVSTNRVAGTARSYQLANAAGSLLLMINTFYYRAYPSSFVNLLWMGIAVLAMLRAWRRRRAEGLELGG